MWALRSRPRTKRAAVSWYRGAIVDVGRLMRTELQLSMHCKTSDVTRCNVHSGSQNSGVGTSVVDGSSRCSPVCSHVTSSAAHCPEGQLDYEQTWRIGQRCGRRSDCGILLVFWRVDKPNRFRF